MYFAIFDDMARVRIAGVGHEGEGGEDAAALATLAEGHPHGMGGQQGGAFVHLLCSVT